MHASKYMYSVWADGHQEGQVMHRYAALDPTSIAPSPPKTVLASDQVEHKIQEIPSKWTAQTATSLHRKVHLSGMLQSNRAAFF